MNILKLQTPSALNGHSVLTPGGA